MTSETPVEFCLHFTVLVQGGWPTVQIGNSHPVHWRLTSEPLAKRPKSRRESGQNTLILKF